MVKINRFFKKMNNNVNKDHFIFELLISIIKGKIVKYCNEIIVKLNSIQKIKH